MDAREQTILELRAALDREATATHREKTPLNEISRINNELANAQRQLAEKNAELLRLNQSLDEANGKVHQDAENLRVSETCYRRLFESAKDGILILDAATGKIEDVNPYLCQLLGYAPDDFLSKQLWEIGTFRDIAANQSTFRTLQEQEYVRYDDLPLETKDGQKVSVEFVSNVYTSGVQQVIQCNIRDISARKSAEADSVRLASIVEFSSDAIISNNLDGIITSWNAGAQTLYGYTAQEAIGRPVSFLAPSDLSDEMPQLLEKVRHGEPVQNYETVRVGKDGLRKEISLSISPLRDGKGNITGASSIKRDITKRKQSEDLLRKSHENLAVAQQIAHLGSWELDLSNLDNINANPLRWSDEIFRILGYSPGEFEPSNEAFFRAVHPDDRATLSRIMAEAIAGGASYSIEHRIILPDGRERIVHAQSQIIYNEETGQPVRMVGLGQDITERKQIEQKLRISQIHMSAILQSALDAIVSMDQEGRLIEWNPAAEAMFGYQRESVIGRSLADLIVPPALREQHSQGFKRYLQTGEAKLLNQRIEVTAMRWDGSEFPVELTITRHAIDGPPTFSGYIRDITQRKESEAALRESEMRYRALAEAAPDDVFIVNRDGILQYLNHQAAQKFGSLPGVLIGKSQTELFPPHLAEANRIEADQVFQSGEPLYQEAQRKFQDSELWHGTWLVPLKNAEGEVLELMGVARDITAQKQAEAALRASEERYRSLFESNPQPMWVYDLETLGFLAVNDAAIEHYGYSRDEFLAMTILEIRPPGDHAAFREVVSRPSPANGKQGIWRHCKKNGAIIEAELSTHELSFKERPARLALAQDITERLEAEKKIRFQAHLLDEVGQAVIATEINGTVVYWNRYSELLYGWAEQDAMGRNISSLVVPQTGHSQADEIMTHLNRGERWSGEFMVQRRDGTSFPAAVINTPIYDETGALSGIIGISQDISERKKTTAALEARTREIVTIWESMSDAFFSVDTEWRFTHINSQAGHLWHSLWPGDVEELIGKNIWEVFPTAVNSAFYTEYHRAMETQVVVNFEALYRPDNAWREVHAYPSPIGLSVYFRDITERKQAEQALQRSEQEQRALAERSEHERAQLAEAQAVAKMGSWELDLSTNVLTWSEENYRIFGIDHTEFGASFEAFLALIHPDDRATVNQAYTESVANHTPYAVDHRLQMQDGSLKIVHERCQTFYDDNGRPIRSVGTTHDITERKLAEEKVLQSEANLARAQEIACLGSWELDLSNLDELNKNPLQWSDQVFRIFGYQPGQIEVSNENFFGAVHPDDRAEIYETITQAIQKQKPYNIDHRILLPDGNERVVQEQGETVFDERSGQPLKMVGTVQDITERKQTELLLHESQQRLALATEAAHIGIWDWDVVKNKMIWDAQMYALYGIRKQDFTGAYDTWQRGLHPEDRGQAEADITAALIGGQEFHPHFRVVWPNGEVHHIEAHALVQRAPDGSALRMIGVNWDITARRRAEDALQQAHDKLELRVAERTAELERANVALREEERVQQQIMATLSQSEERFRLLVESVHDYAILMLSPTGHIMTWNAGAERMKGYRAEEIIGRHFSCFYTEEDQQAGKPEQELRSAETEGYLDDEGWRVRQDGSRFWATVVITALRDGSGNLRGFAKVSRDITERKNIEAALQQAKAEAERANLAKSEFLSRMSHELRTPLNAILGFGQILDRQDLTPRSRESVGHILKGGRHLLDLINEVLDIARVEAGHLEVSLEPVALRDVVPDACALVRPLAAERNIRLGENTSEMPRSYVVADLQRLKQVLINLLSNAIKYNHEAGQVMISCGQSREGWISIAVRDTGPGISSQDMPKLFTPFERLSASTSGIEGTGLGLVLSQRLVTAMGGTLSAQSTLGQGTTFILELPEAPAPEEQVTNVPPDLHQAHPDKKVEGTYAVLCIEDNPSNLHLMEALFEGRPEITLLTAIQGSVGLDVARQHEPDLILLDLDLPDIHGSEVLARLQKSALTRDIPVVVVSADATPTQIERLLTAGAKAYLTKPLDVGQFLDTVDKFLQVTPP